MAYDKDDAQTRVRTMRAPATHRGYPVVTLSVGEASGEVLVTYGNPDDGYYTGPLAGGPVANPYALQWGRTRLGRDDVPAAGAPYKHMKGGLYEVLATSVCEATGVALVQYRSRETGSAWTRSLDNFLDRVPRFAPVPAPPGAGA